VEKQNLLHYLFITDLHRFKFFEVLLMIFYFIGQKFWEFYFSVFQDGVKVSWNKIL
jgi:hypothetical protein